MAIVDPTTLQAVLGLSGSTLYDEALYVQVAQAADDYVTAYLDDDTVTLIAADQTPPAVTEATLALAVELWQHRHAAGGEVQGADWTPVSPYRLGRSLLAKVQGLLAPYLDTGSMVG